MIKGIDVSHWQDDKSTPQKMDFKKAVENGAKFVFIKVSERGAIDRDFEYNWTAAREAGLLRGGYHFLRWDLTGLLQARIFSEVMRDDPGELPPVADFEAPRMGSRYPSNALLEQFLVEVETKTGRKPIIYTSPGYWNIHGRDKTTKQYDHKWAYYPLWVAQYVKSYQADVSKPDKMQPWGGRGKKWTFWQYTANGDGLAFGAETKSIDLNWFNGSMEELNAFADISDTTPAPPAPAAPTSKPLDIKGLKKSVEKTIDDWAKKQK